MHRSNPALLLTISAAIAACSDDEGVETTEETAEDNGAMQACDAEPLVLTTDDGVEFVQTPDSCFEGLTGWSYAPQYLEIDGLRQAYVDEGPDDGPVVLLLHGQPTWSYLYRTMIPGLVDAGYRVIAMDHVGMGRSDKPTDIEYYSYLGHGDRLLRFIEGLDLRDINLFVQDWGSQIGLRVAGLNPELFARIAVGNGSLIVSPAGVEPFPPVENPNEVQDLEPIFAIIPDQQPAFYDGCERLIPELDFGAWIEYALTAAGFHASEVVEGLTWFDVSTDVEAAYDAPFPRREYMAGVRTFPSLVNEMPGQNDEAWAGLQAFERPFATVWGDNDPGQQGSCEVQNELILSIPGSVGMPHVRLPEASHFLQDDQGEEVARRLVDIFAADPVRFDLEARYCEVLLVRMDGNEAFAEVWGTQNISECTPATWEALDADAIASETGAVAAILNGPRLAAMSSGIIAGGPRGLERQSFGGLQMRFLATLLLDSDQSTERAPYTEADVVRTSRFTIDAGAAAFELSAPDGSTYVMISVSQIVDPELGLDDLPGLGERLELPEGWTYQARTLEADLELLADGSATLVQDEYQNSYQRTVPRADATDDGMTLPVLNDGTGTPCSGDADCAGLDASLCLESDDVGFCTIEGCTSGGCGAPYACCTDCAAEAAPFLAFEDSACVPETLAVQLESGAGCTCD